MPEMKQIPGFEERYSITSDGQVWSHVSGRFLKTHTNPRTGYVQVHLGRNFQTYVHRLVLAAWRGPCPDGFQVHHINSVRDDNRVENLEYVTQQDNLRLSSKTWGEGHGAAKLTEADVRKIRATPDNVTCTALASEHGVAMQTVWKIRNGLIWRNL